LSSPGTRRPGRKRDIARLNDSGLRLRLCVSKTSSYQDDIAPEIIAKKVIELAKGGERDPERLCDYALANLRLGMPQTLLK
jgi:hypothetical protein